jgi:CheY-like chemotaxis protein
LPPVRILIADDHEGWRNQLRLLLRGHPEWQVICDVSDGPEAVQKTEELRPDLILIDVGLPTLNGIEAARQISHVSPNTKILFVSQDNSLDVVQVAFSTGAQGFVYKARAQYDLGPAIDAVLRGGQFVSSMLKGYKFTDVPRGDFSHRHEVQFYVDDSVFLESFACFIAAALEAGDVAIAVATESHLDSLDHRLKAQGLDIDTAKRCGTYIPLDVVRTLSTFMVNDMPDPDRFFEVVGGLIQAASKAGNKVHPRIAACGECAPTVWAEGKAEAAILVEQLWDQLAVTYEIDILCGYALNSFNHDEDQLVFHSICAVHSAVYS